MEHPAGSPSLAVDSQRIEPALVAELYRQYADELRSFLLGVLSDLELANEVLQSTFTKLVELGHTSHAESRKGWLFRVAFNEAVTTRRRQAVRDKAARILQCQSRPETESPEDFVCRGETIERVRQSLKRLAPDDQRLLRLRIYDEKTYATIASELGLPLGTVYARMQQAFRKLRDQLGHHE